MFHAWLVNTRNTAAISAPAARPGVSDRKNTMVNENPRMGTDCRMSSSGISTAAARRLLAASVAYVNVKTSEATIATSMRNAVCAA